MTAGRQLQADHGRYIRAARRAIQARCIHVTGVDLTTSYDVGRAARLALSPDPEAFAEPVPADARACWDEENGWSLLVRREPAGSRLSKGLGVLPDPGDVAAWVVVALAHPELTPSYEDGPFRVHSVPDPEFEAWLSR